jgi:hypothetical protein
MQRVLAACGGFLLAVLWFDLMFDVQVLRYGGAEVLPEPVLASIASYYRRVTTQAFPMNRLVAAVMVVTVGGSAYASVRGSAGWRERVALLSGAGAVALAALRVVPDAVRLGARTDSPEIQSLLARAIFHDHLICILAIGLFLVLQLAPVPCRKEPPVSR